MFSRNDSRFLLEIMKYKQLPYSKEQTKGEVCRFIFLSVGHFS